jgi:ceramide glucosyltransferase
VSGADALGIAIAVWLLVAFVYRALALRAVDHAFRFVAAPFMAVPPPGDVELVRPLHGAPAGLAACLASFFEAARLAGVGLRTAVASPHDPALEAALREAAETPGVRFSARVGAGPAGQNRKMANLVQSLADCDADVLVFSDADVDVPPDYVERMLAPLKDDEVGLTTCLYRSVPAASLASRLDALVTNTHFLPGVCSALRLEGLHFALGASIAVRRDALRAAGGLDALLEESADDFLLARHVERAGFRLALAPVVVAHVLEDEGAAAALRRHLRWGRVSRSVRRKGYAGQIVTHGAAPALALAALAAVGLAPAVAALAPFAWWAVQIPALARRAANLGMDRRDLALVPVVDVLAFGVWAGGLFGRARPS